MTLSEMSIDEAIALACREVPGCEPDKYFQPMDAEDFSEVSRRVWFHSATIWFLTESARVAAQPLEGQPTFNLRRARDGGWYISPSVGVFWFPRLGPFLSEYHALAAAVLRVAGKVVP